MRCLILQLFVIKACVYLSPKQTMDMVFSVLLIICTRKSTKIYILICISFLDTNCNKTSANLQDVDIFCKLNSCTLCFYCWYACPVQPISYFRYIDNISTNVCPIERSRYNGARIPSLVGWLDCLTLLVAWFFLVCCLVG